MPYYELQNDTKITATQIINSVQILGSETFTILELIRAIQDDKNAPYHELDEKLAVFFIDKINKSTFIGNAAIAISKLLITLNRPLKELPQKTPNPPQPLNDKTKRKKINDGEPKDPQTSEKQPANP
jgi:hypothetical protein